MICLYFKSPLFWHYFWNFGLPRLVLSSFFSAEWFGTEFRDFASIFVPRNGISSCFLFRWGVRKGIPRDCFYFLFNGTEFRILFSSAEGFGTEFRDFLFRGTAGIPSEITICSVYSVFRGIIFLSEIPNPSSDCAFGFTSSKDWQYAMKKFCINSGIYFFVCHPSFHL